MVHAMVHAYGSYLWFELMVHSVDSSHLQVTCIKTYWRYSSNSIGNYLRACIGINLFTIWQYAIRLSNLAFIHH